MECPLLSPFHRSSSALNFGAIQVDFLARIDSKALPSMFNNLMEWCDFGLVIYDLLLLQISNALSHIKLLFRCNKENKSARFFIHYVSSQETQYCTVCVRRCVFVGDEIWETE